ncbi:hypothetical protein [Candidatus Pantoea edessiphila]|uniref:Lipoprotein n=1 Tax=Candidatus Pantoea edessiphila TaxID=2044610 RepID=A0A2P5SX24_9GAMM|nr:hypothetical protein [Candidatus Pantoea edessiphila]PPI86898.1 hypothetical protein CRV10_01445 [Candidatus Pantoea edessiphila]
MKKLTNKNFILIIIMTFIIVSCDMKSIYCYKAPPGFSKIIICNNQPQNPIVKSLHKSLAIRNIEVVENNPKNREIYSKLVFSYPESKQSNSSVNANQTDCDLIHNTKIYFILPEQKIFLLTNDYFEALCPKKIKINNELQYINDQLINNIFDIYKLNHKATVLNPKTKPLNRINNIHHVNNIHNNNVHNRKLPRLIIN